MGEEIVGVFQVLRNNYVSQDIIGTAFAVKTCETVNKYYLLTAYHVISELEAKGQTIIVNDEKGNFSVAKRIFPFQLSKEYREFGRDYALLEIYSNIKYKTYRIASIDRRSECYVRGAIPPNSTVFTTIKGNVLGIEGIRKQKNVLQISLDIGVAVDKDNKIITEQEMLCGMSGAPVLLDKGNEDVCIGLLANVERNNRGIAKYAIPMKTIIEDCLNKFNIAYVMYENINSNLSSGKEWVENIFENTEDFLFSEENMDAKAWDYLSDCFYNGIPVDNFLHYIIKSDYFREYNAEVKSAIFYYYARLLFKRGQNNVAFKMFDEIKSMYRNVSALSKEKLQALVTSRSVIERKIENPKETLKVIAYAGEKVVNLTNLSEEYIANELASLYGRGLTNLFSINTDFNYEEKIELTKIYNEHKLLLESNPVKLRKQDVVNTSLRWYIGFRCVNKEYDTQGLLDAVKCGFAQSKLRKNKIFYIQSVLSYAIVLALLNEKSKSVKLLLLSVQFMHEEKIFLFHEGIKQLMLFLKNEFIFLYAIVKLAFNTQCEKEFIQKVSLYRMDLNSCSFERIILDIKDIYNILYSDCELYDVGMDSLTIFL